MTHIPKSKPAGRFEMLVASIVESILELVKAVRALDVRMKRLEKGR